MSRPNRTLGRASTPRAKMARNLPVQHILGAAGSPGCRSAASPPARAWPRKSPPCIPCGPGRRATVRPAGPEPMTATFWSKSPCFVNPTDLRSMASATNRLRSRMATGRSVSPLRQRFSQGWGTDPAQHAGQGDALGDEPPGVFIAPGLDELDIPLDIGVGRTRGHAGGPGLFCRCKR